MVGLESAKLMNVNEIREVIDEEYTNPTIERMMFIETKQNGEFPGKVFPCYMEAWALEEGKTEAEADHLVFQCCIVQCMEGGFNLVRVHIRDSELGVSKRIWDKPPTKGLRNDHPWMDTLEVQ